MLGWLFASPADRRLLGTDRFRGPTPWVIAIMSFSIIIIAATGLALANTAGALTSAIQARGAHSLFPMVSATPTSASAIMITMAANGTFQARARA